MAIRDASRARSPSRLRNPQPRPLAISTVDLQTHIANLENDWGRLLKKLRHPSPARRVPFMAPNLPAGFLRREGVADALCARILNGVHGTTTVLRGPAGSRKTTLAVGACYDLQGVFDHGILWVALGERRDLASKLAMLCTLLTGRRPRFADEEEAMAIARDELRHKECLLVLDDVRNPRDVVTFEAIAEHAAIIATTRDDEWHGRGHSVIVGDMSDGEAVALVSAGFDDHDRQKFALLSDRLGRLPQQLTLANRAIRERVAAGDSLDRAIEFISRAFSQAGDAPADSPPQDSLLPPAGDVIRRSLDVNIELLNEGDRLRYVELGVLPSDTACRWRFSTRSGTAAAIRHAIWPSTSTCWAWSHSTVRMKPLACLAPLESGWHNSSNPKPRFMAGSRLPGTIGATCRRSSIRTSLGGFRIILRSQAAIASCRRCSLTWTGFNGG
jgi:hypothetical protein